jgi:hypothetical protein
VHLSRERGLAGQAAGAQERARLGPERRAGLGGARDAREVPRGEQVWQPVPLEEPGGDEEQEIVGLARGAGSHPDILSRSGGMLAR